MKPKFVHRYILALASCGLMLGSFASAATGTWNVDANGLWNVAGNWTPGIADGSGFIANFTNNITADRTVSLNSDRTINNVVFSDANTATAGSWILNNNGTSTNNLTLAGTTPGITVNALGTGKTATISAIIEGTVGLVKSGTGTLVLSGSNTYSGTTTVREGTLIAGANAPSGSAGAFGNSSTEIILGVASGNTAASILTGGAFTIGRVIRNATNNSTDNGTRVLTLGGNSADNSVFSGNIFLGTTNNTSKGIQVTAAAGGQVTFSGVIQNPTGQNGGETSSAAALTAVTKVGAGTVILSGSNTYTGATTVTAGTLVIDGNQTSATGTVTVENGGTLGGVGTLGGALTVNSGGTHAVGNSPGLQTINGATTYNSGSIFAWDLAADKATATGTRGTDYDAVNINGALTVNSAAIFRVVENTGVDFTDAFWDTTRTWNDIFNVTGTVTSGWSATAVDIYNTAGVLQNYSIQGAFTITSTTLTWTAFNVIPEPSSILAGLLLAAGLFRRRR